MAAVFNPFELIDSSTTDSVQYTRLHVTPLDESLLSVVVPSSVLPRARNISYHTIEAFPEKRYGFVDLPLADADKIKKKLYGAVLRGTKMRVEKARPEAIPQPTGDAAATDGKKEKKKSKKRKREADVTPGIELEGRKVKRGWTTTEREMVEEKRNKSKKEKKSKDDKKDKKKKHVKSKYTDGPECLFKTKLPDAGSSSKTTEDAAEHKKKRKSSREVVVHEFEKTMKHPSFLKSVVEKSSSKAVTFEDGVGWVDETGTVVEPVVNKRPKDHSSRPKPAELQSSNPPPVAEDDTSSSDSSSDDSEDDVSDGESDSSDEKAETMAPPKKLKVDTLALSSPVSTTKTESARPKSSSSVTSLTIKIPPATPAATKVHPLEALYKRPKGDSSTTGAPQEAQPFSFFDGDDEDIEEEDAAEPSSQPPMTPFTKQDFEFRNTRSAAPTPDTAHPNRRTLNLWPRNNSVDEEDEDEEDGGDDQDDDDEDTMMASMSNETTLADDSKQTAVSDFQKQFWESRGDLNRSWRKRRKAASKEKRYRENRGRAERAI
ncbi:hypothetical protein F4821DRAFT_246944 [Hypoxylon rubiginosum]|uniref:Uncharacterized protein n=1 Tax=Hypoxylon rubiginosum TaxID=110542 RepID=A0ACC0CQA2_9PEZI|nr:hypothetical protein F4821DRAFT_246944 [Hypoxylon rubiginosum]